MHFDAVTGGRSRLPTGSFGCEPQISWAPIFGHWAATQLREGSNRGTQFAAPAGPRETPAGRASLTSGFPSACGQRPARHLSVARPYKLSG